MDNPTIVFKKPKEVVIENRTKPEPGKGELLIETKCSLISTGTELTILSGNFPSQSAWADYGKFPFIPGYSNIGVVIDVGKGVDKSWIGCRVASTSTHSLYVTAPVESVYKIPDEVKDEEAAFFTIGMIVMNGIRRSQIQWGEIVVVYGLGLLGQLTVQFSALSGARPVIGIDISEFRLKLLPDKPYIIGINSNQVDAVKEVKEYTKTRMADVVFEVTGNKDLIPKEFALLKKQGRFVLLSSPSGPTLFDFNDLCNVPSFTIIGAHNSSHPSFETPYNPWTKSRHVELFFDLIKTKDINLNNLISHHSSFSKAVELYKMLLNDRSKAMGVILLWQ